MIGDNVAPLTQEAPIECIAKSFCGCFMKVLNLLWRTIKIHIAKFGLWLFKKNSKE